MCKNLIYKETVQKIRINKNLFQIIFYFKSFNLIFIITAKLIQ